jgi:outer membrane lipoprotein-sorting protein
MTADAEITMVEDGETSKSSAGKAYISLQGKLRIDLTGDEPGTILCTPPKLFLHDPTRVIVEQYNTEKHRDRLAQYALLGFEPRGTKLEKDFLVTLLDEESLDGRKVVLLELTPKQDGVREAVSKIHLWIDQSSWLPVKQQVYHGSPDTHLIVAYANVSRDDSISQQVFKPKWPKGTEKINR